MDSSQKTRGWLLSLFTLPLQEQPLSLVLCLGAATLLLSNSLTALVLKHGQPPHKKSEVAKATAALPLPIAQPQISR
jgi:hypothetical protein